VMYAAPSELRKGDGCGDPVVRQAEAPAVMRLSERAGTSSVALVPAGVAICRGLIQIRVNAEFGALVATDGVDAMRPALVVGN